MAVAAAAAAVGVAAGGLRPAVEPSLSHDPRAGLLGVRRTRDGISRSGP